VFSCTLSYYANKKKHWKLLTKQGSSRCITSCSSSFGRCAKCQHAAHCYCTARHAMNARDRRNRQNFQPSIQATPQASPPPSVRGGWGRHEPTSFSSVPSEHDKKNLTDAAAQAQPWVDAVQGVALSRRCCSRHQQAAIRGPLRARTFADQILLRWKKPFFCIFY
jgi:hypothetical protein